MFNFFDFTVAHICCNTNRSINACLFCDMTWSLHISFNLKPSNNISMVRIQLTPVSKTIILPPSSLILIIDIIQPLHPPSHVFTTCVTCGSLSSPSFISFAFCFFVEREKLSPLFSLHINDAFCKIFCNTSSDSRPFIVAQASHTTQLYHLQNTTNTILYVSY